MASSWTLNGALEVINEEFLHVFPRVDRVMPQAFEPCERSRFQNHREVYNFCRICPSRNFDSSRVDTQPLTGVLLAVVFLQILHVDWVEADRVLSIVYVLTKGWEPIGFICRASVMPGVDDISCITEVAAIVVVTS